MQLFGGFDYGKAPQVALGNKIFAMSQEQAQDEYDKFPQLKLKEDMSKYLLNVSYGTIKTTTEKNQWFGISGGTDVTLNVIKFNITDVSCQGFTNYFVYADL